MNSYELKQALSEISGPSQSAVLRAIAELTEREGIDGLALAPVIRDLLFDELDEGQPISFLSFKIVSLLEAIFIPETLAKALRILADACDEAALEVASV
jgi:hypothetical protein